LILLALLLFYQAVEIDLHVRLNYFAFGMSDLWDLLKVKA